MTRPRILLADDHTLLVDALGRLLEPEFEVVDTVADGLALLKSVETLQPDVVIVDIEMPLLSGLDAAARVKELAPATKVVMLTQHHEIMLANEAFARRASAYVLKQEATVELIEAIRVALRGGRYVSKQLAAEFDADRRQHGGPRRHQLTVREREVLGLLAQGKSMKLVASILCISRRTVEFHKYRIMQRLGLGSSAELVHYAVRRGLLP
jgi:DNA-binding NarL/FixJ family response regulator